LLTRGCYGEHISLLLSIGPAHSLIYLFNFYRFTEVISSQIMTSKHALGDIHSNRKIFWFTSVPGLRLLPNLPIVELKVPAVLFVFKNSNKFVARGCLICSFLKLLQFFLSRPIFAGLIDGRYLSDGLTYCSRTDTRPDRISAILPRRSTRSIYMLTRQPGDEPCHPLRDAEFTQ
jgi:hypothetical protein